MSNSNESVGHHQHGSRKTPKLRFPVSKTLDKYEWFKYCYGGEAICHVAYDWVQKLPSEPDGKLACPVCGKLYTRKALLGHLLICHGQELVNRVDAGERLQQENQTLRDELLVVKHKLDQAEAKLENVRPETEQERYRSSLRMLYCISQHLVTQAKRLGNGKYQCPLCSRSYVRKKAMRVHLVEVHDKYMQSCGQVSGS